MAQTKKTTKKNNTKKQNKDNTKIKSDIKEMQEKRKADKRVVDEIWGVIFIALGIFLFAAVQFNAAGEFGNTLGDCLKGILGLMGILFPWYLVVFGILLFAGKTVHISGKSFIMVLIILLMLALVNSGRFIDSENIVFTYKEFYQNGIGLKSGGFFGMTVGSLLVKYIGKVGLIAFSLVIVFICLMLVINTPVSRGIEKIHDKVEERRIIKAKEAESVFVDEDDYVLRPEQKPLPEPVVTHSRKREEQLKIVTAYDDKPYDSHKSSVDNEKRNKEKSESILKLMKDKSLFSDKKSGKSGSYGIEEKSNPKDGYGLDGKPKAKPVFNVPVTQEASGPVLNTYQAHEPEETVTMSSSSATMQDVGVVNREVKKMTKKEAESITLSNEDIAAGTIQKPNNYKKPSVNLLNRPVATNKGNLNADLKQKAMKLEQTLQNFHVDARVVQVTQGPAITRYEIQPNIGVKVSSIVRLADDIALNLEAKSIRIEAPIPGKAAVGIEVENDKINMVTLREIIDSKEFKEAKSKITFAVGKDIAGKAIVADLKSMPHLLIAGSTGSGKSVCINSIITSILYKADPDEVKLVLIDPKVVELGNYNGIPHLLIPVVTEPAKAAAALNWAVAEMTDRYKKFAEAGVRDLESYNESVKMNGDLDLVMPQIVVIIDELADLMMAAPSQVEESICRLAQMARAAGMHLIVATQRPSVDIITGVIKANIPSRIAFAVSSQFDSRTILDMSGAEKLVGKGDMLFNPLGMGKPVRVQGTFVSDKEVHDVIEHVKSQVIEVEYSGDVLNTIEKGNITPDKDDDGDELLADAIECVVKAKAASVSMLQRRFRIGYNRAARIVDMMEARGIVGPQDGSRPRQVLLTEEELEEMKNEAENME